MSRAGARIRAALAGDAEAAAEVWLRARRAAIPYIPAPVHSDREVREYFAGTVLRERDVFVADHATAGIVGVMVLDGAWIDQLYVDPSWQGRGLGSAFVELAKRLRPRGLELWTFAANAGARRFYERQGFRAVGGTDGDNEEGAPDIHYRWPAEPESDRTDVH
jgi:GNAT superfamily N-acetyltransferase